MTKTVDVTVERVIATNRAALAAYTANMGNAAEWYRNIKSVDWKTAPGTAVGARAAFVAEFMGRPLAYTYEIQEHIPGERLILATQEGPFPMQTIYEWSDAGKGKTRMRLTNRGAPTGFKALLMPLMSLAMRRAMTLDLAALAKRAKRL